MYSLHGILGSGDAIEIKIKLLTSWSLMLRKTLGTEGLIGLTVCLKNVDLYECLSLLILRPFWRKD